MKKIIVFLCLLMGIISGCGSQSNDEASSEIISLMADSQLETLAYLYNNDGNGKRFGIIGGIHGNETAGFTAAEKMKDEIIASYPNASILFIPSANSLGIKQNKRYGEGYSDINRSFLADPTVSETEKLASQIKKLVIDFEPEFFIDHHESKNNYLNTDGKYQLGNTIIVNDVGDSVMHNLFIVENVNVRITDDIPFKLETNPPMGSFNKTISEALDIYVATIETNRQLPLDQRVDQQIIVAEEIIKYFMESSD